MKNSWILLGIGLLGGLIIFAAIRFICHRDSAIHYHANFAVYVNGQREQFNNPLFYEETEQCTADTLNDPHHRAHLHDQQSDVIHVHAQAVTWGQFFENLGYSIGSTHLKTDRRLLVPKNSSQLLYLLNGQPIDDPSNRVIKSEDKLLVSYGKSSQQQLADQADAISSSAAIFNQRDDPASCAGGEPVGWRARLEHIIK